MNNLFARYCVNCGETLVEIPAYDQYAAVYRCPKNCGAEDACLTHDQVHAECRSNAMQQIHAAVDAVKPEAR